MLQHLFKASFQRRQMITYAFSLIAILVLCNASNLSISVDGLQSSIQNNTKILENIKEIDPCLLKSVYSFIYSSSYPPKTTDELRSSCRNQMDGFKCVRERSRGALPILRRGLVTFIQGRQRFHRKYCTDPNSEASQNFVKDFRCIMDKKLKVYNQIDSDFSNTLNEIYKKNFNDSKKELGYLCCALVNYRKNIIDNVGPECNSSKAQIEEMIMSIIPNEINLLCEEEDKLNSKVCPKLEALKIPKTFDEKTGRSPSATTLYLITTLGEPN